MATKGGPAANDDFLSSVSPWVHPAGRRPAGIAARRGADLRCCPLDAARLFPRTGGQALAERHESRRACRLQEPRRRSRNLGLPLDPQPPFLPVNPAPPFHALLAAQQAGGGDLAGPAAAFPRAVRAEGREVSGEATVKAILADRGFDPAVAVRHPLAAAEDPAANREKAVARGAFGVPFRVVGEEKFRGRDRLDDLDRHLAGRL